MKTISRIVLLSAISFTAIFSAGCPERTSIADIEADPSRYQNKEVAIAGVVKDSYGISIPGTKYGGGAYKIDDGTGAIWVFTNESVPAKGTQIGIKGTIATGVNWKGKNYGLGMYENDRRINKR